MPTISKINGLQISAADAQYVAAGNVAGPLGNNSVELANSASYIDPTFISASAAASGFGSGGGTPAATSSWAIQAQSASYSKTLGASIGNDSNGALRLFDSDGNTLSSVARFTSSLANTASYALTLAGTVTNATSASFANTASFVNTLNQNVTINGNLTVFGTASYSYVSASQLNVGTNTISVNVAEPAQRFGGLIVYDSGSLSHQATASFLWDSEKNKWIYQNVSGSGYDGGMAIFGPRNTSGLGNEQGTTNNALMKGQGGDHITSSRIFDDGTNVYTNSDVQITGSLTVTGNVNATSSWANNATLATSASVVYGTGGIQNLVYVTDVAGGKQLSMHPSSGIARIDTSTGHVRFTAVTASINGNLTGTASFATQALTASYALSSAGVAGGVTSITAGTGISIDQSTGNVTITNTGGGGGGTNLGLVYAVSLGYLMP